MSGIPTIEDRPRVERFGVAFLVVLALLAPLFILTLVPFRSFDPDEFQHAHSAYLISRGELPYRDYFEHHPPLLHFLLAPVVSAMHADRGPADAFKTLHGLRVIGWCVAMIGGVFHFLFARRTAGSLVAGLAAALLWTSLVMLENLIEIRPDTFAFACLQFALWLLAGTFSRGKKAAAFVVLGIGLLFTQKLVFPILGVFLFLLARSQSRAQKGREVAAAALGIALPTVLCAAYFFLRGGGAAFIEDVFLINLRWKARLSAWPFFLSEVAARNPFMVFCGALGVLIALAALRKHDPSDEGRTLALFVALGALLGLFLLPVAWSQYYVLVLPALAILGAFALVSGLRMVLSRIGLSPFASVAAILVTLLGIGPGRSLIVNQRLRTSESKISAISAILDNSTPDEAVLDGYSGIGVFRPNAFRHFFFHAELRQMLDEGTVQELEAGLRDGTVAPRFASADSQLASVSEGVRRFLADNFEPIGIEPVLVRVFPGGTQEWDDTRVRMAGQFAPSGGPFVLSLEGWSAPRVASGRSFRTSSGKKSSVLLPVLTPAALDGVILSARVASTASGLSATVLVNDHEIGQMGLSESFSEIRFDLEPGVLKRGLNRIEFVYPIRPAKVDSSLALKFGNEVLSLESVAFTKR